jgi:hypothetical protein
MRPKILCTKVYEEVTVAGVIGRNEEEVFIRESSLMGKDLASEGKAVMSLDRTRDLFILGVENSRLYS